ncbi:Cof-type HAD-IIB family hydrolase [Anaerocolumna sp. AGMB13025]|uniref:Cof-type HAD-IIB family hydrolase n=1 Tax=Anaerocolumna sp. AGMB13025 TaxID=3039116 RepID=UPI00241F0702|nr:Cof-type HAD-IIB family hydrolase [Anaerocolumna sp. AGMB13025]WFR59474.1 Cof-type HAD-IIB family hydrolase [Anaerocolumna sp. AGMB13025]
MERKIMFFDIDGTILAEDTRIIPDSTVKAIKAARAKGHLAFINTGRTYFNIEKEIRDIGFDGFVCGCGTYINIDNQVLVAVTIEEATCKTIIELLRKHNMDAVLEGLEDVYFDSKEIISDDMKMIQDHFHKRGYGLMKNWDHKGLLFDKIFAKANPNTDMNQFKTELGDGFDYIDRGEDLYEIVPSGYSKASGIKQVLEHYHLSLENTYVFGDSSNDLPMFRYAPNSIAMGNSDACILNIASFVTKDIHEDGIAYAMQHFQII